jgi:hypothetical protein
MIKKIILAVTLHLVCVIYVSAQLRSFNDIFPNLGKDERSEVFNGVGFVKSDSKSNGLNISNIKKTNIGIDSVILNKVLNMDPNYLVEAISVIPENPENMTFLNIYNALGNIRNLKGSLYNSYTRKQLVPLFEDATRVSSEKQTIPIPDPAPSNTVPKEETVYIKLKDINFGNSYYRGEVKLYNSGLCYSLVNFKSLSYLFVPVIKEGHFSALLYFEPVKEGLLVYGFAGINISDFFASKIDVNSAISKRLAVITSWAVDGLKK